jgi:hypothetical protein
MFKNSYFFSIVSYIHQMRGDRVSLGVAVWHPTYGGDFKHKSDLKLLRYIDADADENRIEYQFSIIKASVEEPTHGDRSPLEELSARFRHGLVVGEPLEASGPSLDALLERLWNCLVSPDSPPKSRASYATDKTFTRSFLESFNSMQMSEDLIGLKEDYVEKRTFKPVKIAASYVIDGHEDIWRAFSFRNTPGAAGHQTTKAKAIVLDGRELMNLDQRGRIRLKIAVQLPRPENRRDEWVASLDWLKRDSVENGEPFAQQLKQAVETDLIG